MSMGENVAVSAADPVPAEHIPMALDSRIFQDWHRSLDPKFGVTKIELQAVDFRGKPDTANVMFIRMRVKAANANFPQIVELRGGTVILLVILDCDGKKYTVLVNQPRLASGEYNLAELPAGMIDGGTFGGAAAKEIQEELGLTFTENELIDLTQLVRDGGKGILLTPGLLDERAKVYMAWRAVTGEELVALEGKATGHADEGETISLSVIHLSELHRHTRDAKALIALALYRLWKQEMGG